jgi:hypothetical protein
MSNIEKIIFFHMSFRHVGSEREREREKERERKREREMAWEDCY